MFARAPAGRAAPGYRVYEEDDLPAAAPQAAFPLTAEMRAAARMPIEAETPDEPQVHYEPQVHHEPQVHYERGAAGQARRRAVGRVAAGGLLTAAVVAVAGLALADALRGQHRRPVAVGQAKGAPYRLHEAGGRLAAPRVPGHRRFAWRVLAPRRGLRRVQAPHVGGRVPPSLDPMPRARAGWAIALVRQSLASPPAGPRQSEFGFER